MGKIKKIMIVFGTRPEAIKLAPLVRLLRDYSNEAKTIVVITGQHREMLDQVLDLFKITVDYDLNIMESNQTLFGIVANSIQKCKNVFEKEKPDIVLVQGDTTTSFVASLAAYFLKIKVGHIEAGLRTFDKYSPFPEEMNRRLISVIADYHFAPTKAAFYNLKRENVNKKSIIITGNTGIDALLMTVKNKYDFNNLNDKVLLRSLSDVDFNKKVILVTAHRRESFGQSFIEICKAIKSIVKNNSDVEVVYPVHLNPNVQTPVYSILNNIERVHLLPPLSYEIFVQLMNKVYIILTDSGGVQEEAPSLGKPVLVMRAVTERIEAVKSGTVKLVGTDKISIIRETMKLLSDEKAYMKMSRAINPYGDGKASERIVRFLLNKKFSEFEAKY